MFVHKYDYEQKIKIISEYQNGTYGYRKICRIYGISQSALNDWIRLYKTFGPSGLKTNSTASKYTGEVKKAAVQEYLTHQESVKEILKKYQIRSETQLRRWIKKYNGHEELKTFNSVGSVLMTKGRNTTFDERVEIVQYCIANDHNYIETAQKYKISYQQARNYTLKYEAGGVDALQDKRGRSKPASEMTELERLRAENKILRAEKEHAEMEAAFLKKLNEIERRRG